MIGQRSPILTSMRVVGMLAIVGFLLLVSQLVFGRALNDATDDGSLTLVPLAVGLIFLWIAFWRGLATGPGTAILAVLLGFGSLALFGYAILALYPIYFGWPVYFAASGALFVLAITMGIVAYTNERVTSHESSVRE